MSAVSSTEPMEANAASVGTKMVKSEMLRLMVSGPDKPKSMLSLAASSAALMAK